MAPLPIAALRLPLELLETLTQLGVERIETLLAWRDTLGGWDAMVNKSSTTWRNLPQARKAPGSDAEWKLLLKEYPQLIRRPVVVTDDGTVTQGFSDNAFKARFGRR